MDTSAPPTIQPTYIDERSFESFLSDTYDLGLISVVDVVTWCARTCKARRIPFDRVAALENGATS